MRNKILISLGILVIIAVAVWWYFGFSLGFMQFFAAEQSPSPTTTIVLPNVRCVSVAIVSVGQAATLTAEGGQQPYEWFAPKGSPITQTGGTSFGVTYDTPGTKIITVQATSADDSTVDSQPCTVTVQ